MKIAKTFQGRGVMAMRAELDHMDSTYAPEKIFIPGNDDSVLLDAYSQTVSGVVEDARDSVVNIRVRHASRNGRNDYGEGSGS